MKIYIVRHSQKDESLKESKTAHLERELTEIGIQQSILLGEAISGKGIKNIFTSDLVRCITTAQIANVNIKAQIQDKFELLREAEPCSIPNHTQRNEYIISCWKDWNYIPPYGESFNMAKARIDSFFKEYIYGSEDEKPKLIVTHGRLIRIFLKEYLSQIYNNVDEVIKGPYYCAAISEIEITGNKLFINKYNDISYLPRDLITD